MSTKKGLGRLYDKLSLEERFRLDVLAMARGEEEESERLTATCPRRVYTMNDWGSSGRGGCPGTGIARVCGRGEAPGQDKDDSRLSRLVSLPEHHLGRRCARGLP